MTVTLHWWILWLVLIVIGVVGMFRADSQLSSGRFSMAPLLWLVWSIFGVGALLGRWLK
jgi:hypothetical protein